MKIGIDIGGSHICIGIIEENDIIETRYTDIKNEKNKKLFIYEYCKNIINELLSKRQINSKYIEKIGISCPGIVKDNIAYDLPNLGIDKLDIAKELKKSFNTEVFVNNDANCAAYAEKVVGGMKQYSDFIFLCLGTGIGGAVINGGKLIIPKRSSGFEFGHIITHMNGEKCNCGNKGCFERYASMRKFKENVKKYLNIDNELEGEELSKKIYEAYTKGKITHIVDEYINELIFGISNLINIFDPEAICIGGGFVYYKDILLEELIKKLNEKTYIKSKTESIPKIKLAKLGNEAGVIGSVLI